MIKTKLTNVQETQKETSAWAICAIITVFFLPILGIIFGIVALTKLKNNPNQKGKGLAIAAIIIGSAFIIILIIFIIMSLAYYGVLKPQAFLPEKCILAPGIACVEHKVEPSQITLVLSNGLGYDISVQGIDVAGCKSSFDKTIKNGAESKFIIGGLCNNGKPKDKFRGDIILEVIHDGYGRTIYGNLQSTIE